MRRTMSRSTTWLALLMLVTGPAVSLAAQDLRDRPPSYYAPKPTVVAPVAPVAAVASLTAESGKDGIWLGWPPAAGASDYRIERTDNKSGKVETIASGPATSFTFEGSDCSLTAHFKNCTYSDAKLIQGTLYSYRVWTGGGQSPVASARAKCTWQQGESNPKTIPPTYVWSCY